MITRMWRGWTSVAEAGSYQHFLLTKLFPSMRAIPGFVGAEVLCRQEGTEAAFVTLTRFEDMNCVLAFAGEDYEAPVLEPEALQLLSRYDDHAVHFESATFSR
jgi:antibiotic biosynthesis monooxygenase (ABM) superfamily enzyme